MIPKTTRMLRNPVFQSTPPHGGRQYDPDAIRGGSICFNPRPRTGGDVNNVDAFLHVMMFQSTPPHGGRLHPNPQRLDH